MPRLAGVIYVPPSVVPAVRQDSFLWLLKIVTGLCSYCCLERKAKRCKVLEEKQGFKSNCSRQWWEVGKDALTRFLRIILLFCCLTQWWDLPSSWLKLQMYREAIVVKAVVLETHWEIQEPEKMWKTLLPSESMDSNCPNLSKCSGIGLGC